MVSLFYSFSSLTILILEFWVFFFLLLSDFWLGFFDSGVMNKCFMLDKNGFKQEFIYDTHKKRNPEGLRGICHNE